MTVATLRPPGSRLPRAPDRLLLAPGLAVSPLCLGAVRDPDVVLAAFDAGVNFFLVTTDMHWAWYEPLRLGLKRLATARPGSADDIVVAAVSYLTQPEFTRLPFEDCRDSLPGIGRLDVMVVGGAYPEDFETRLPIYQAHRRQALCGVRALGCTFHDRALACRALQAALVDIGFVRSNPRHPGALDEVYARLQPGSAPVYNFNSAAGVVAADRLRGLGVDDRYWTPTFADGYRFALTPEAVCGLLCSFADVAELEHALEGLERGALELDEMDHMVAMAALDAAGVPVAGLAAVNE
jgi:hypothetical protein